jgi:hypothetical protein
MEIEASEETEEDAIDDTADAAADGEDEKGE